MYPSIQHVAVTPKHKMLGCLFLIEINYSGVPVPDGQSSVRILLQADFELAIDQCHTLGH